MVADEERILNVISLASSMFGRALKEVKHDGCFQACCIAAFINVLKQTDTLNNAVDMAVSLNGRVIRDE